MLAEQLLEAGPDLARGRVGGQDVRCGGAFADDVVYRMGVDPNRPLLLQVSRFDPWKDPTGVIDVYRAVRREYPDVQLALVGSMATDDPEGWKLYREVLRYAGMDDNLTVFTNLDGVGALEVNAFQHASEVVLQKSLREGFGLTVSEALWKGVPVVGGNVGGIPMQIGDDAGGRLVSSVDEATEACLELLGDAQLRHRLGSPAASACAATSSRPATCATTWRCSWPSRPGARSWCRPASARATRAGRAWSAAPPEPRTGAGHGTAAAPRWGRRPSCVRG